ncbi:MAG: MBL fold metallo-hydrolase [Beijerinckiaceae bacterium]|nr:MBL fold metallo-hydrolase [Beijerinckiaceae bacterium]
MSGRTTLSRRRFCLCCLGSSALVVAGDFLTPSQVYAEARNIVDIIKSDAATAPITVHRLRDGISVLEGSGGNIAVLTGKDGKLLVDAGIGVSRRQVSAALDTLGNQPITHLINTHWHFDHADGNEWLQAAGARILAHENTRKHLSVTQRVNDWSYDFSAAPLAALPQDVFGQEHVLKLNSNTIELKHYSPAHTDSDISVTFPDADIIHTGDTFWNGVYPFIDYSTGGSIDGAIRAAEDNVRRTTDNTIVIPGHGQPVSKRMELIAFRDMLIDTRANVAALKKKGLGLADITAARPTAAYDAHWGNFVISPALFTRLVFEGV